MMQVGAHISVSKRKLSQAVRDAQEAGLDCAQIFAGSPYRLSVRPVDQEDADETRKLTKDFPLFLHCSYPSCLCPNRPGLKLALVEYLLNMDEYAFAYGARGFVTHVGSYGEGGNRTAGIKKIREMIGSICDRLRTRLILENVAGLGTSLARTPKDLWEMAVGYPDTVGICWDTAHGFAQGVDCSSEQQVDEIVSQLNGCNNKDRLSVVHFNGVTPKVTLGSHLDRHDLLKTSANYSQPAFRSWLKADVPLIIEASKGRDPLPDIEFLREEELTVGVC